MRRLESKIIMIIIILIKMCTKLGFDNCIISKLSTIAIRTTFYIICMNKACCNLELLSY